VAIEKDVVLEQIIEKFTSKIKALNALIIDANFEIDDLENLKIGLRNQIEDARDKFLQEASSHSIHKYFSKEQLND
jgi:predicted  nucleic acid-binding Zn-ribbon protein